MYQRGIFWLVGLFLLGCTNASNQRLIPSARLAMPTAPPYVNNVTPLIPSPTVIGLPAATATLTTPIPTNTVNPCPIPFGWLPYTVQTNDTLFQIAHWGGTTVDEVVAGNCLVNRDQLFIGQTLYLPREVAPTPTTDIILPAPTVTIPQPSPSPIPSTTTPTHEMTIIRFDVFPDVVNTGDDITLVWETTGTEEVYLVTHNPFYRFETLPLNNGNPLPSSGSFTLKAPPYIKQLQFSLGFDLPAETYQTITIPCSNEYFLAVDISTCPPQPVELRQAAYQPFEHGFMVWQDNKIFVLTPHTPSSHLFDDTWDGTLIDLHQDPPDGLFAPVRGFGNVWENHEWIRREFGWATAPEQGYMMEIQETQLNYATPAYLFSLPNGQTIKAEIWFDVQPVWEYVERH